MWTSWETRCGIASYTASLVAELRKLGVEIDVVPVPYLDRSPGHFAQTVARLNQADLVHLQHEYTFFGGIIPRASSLPRYQDALRVPYVVTAHTVFTAAELLRIAQEERPRQRLAKQLLAAMPSYRASVERQPFQGAKAVIVHTAEAQERMVVRRIRPERVHVLPAGLPEPSPEGGRPEQVAAMRQRYGLAGSRVLTIFGFVTPDKGYELALDALRSLPGPVKLLIAGGTRVEHEGGYMETLKETIRARGLESRVAITGYLEDAEVATAMALSDLVLAPHTAANGSYSALIALAHGRPVLASDLACFRELQEEAGCVELFETGDETRLAERAGFLLASTGTRERLARQAQAYAAGRRWSRVAAATLKIYQSAKSS